MVIGRIRCSAAAPAVASTIKIASGPYATDVSASSDSAERPSTGVICSLDTSRARSGGPISQRHTAAAALCSAGCPSDTPVLYDDRNPV